MRVVVYGSRKILDVDHIVHPYLEEHHEQSPITFLMEGGASGADTLARDWAKKHDVPYQTFKADWKNFTAPGAIVKTNQWGQKYNALAGFWRNQAMVEAAPDIGIEFPGGPGTHDMRVRLLKACIPIYRIVGVDPDTGDWLIDVAWPNDSMRGQTCLTT